MAIVFPASPSNNDTFTVGSITYTYDGSKWIGLGVTPTDRLVEGSNKLEIDGSNNLVWTGGTTSLNNASINDQLTIGSGSAANSEYGLIAYANTNTTSNKSSVYARNIGGGRNFTGDNSAGATTFEVYSSGSVVLTQSAATSINSIDSLNSGGGDNVIKVRTQANQGGDPYLKFDAGGSNFVVGEEYNGTTNNKLCLGTGENPSNVTGITINGLGKTVIGSYTLGSEQLRVVGDEADIWLDSSGSGIWRIMGSTGGSTHRFRIYDNTNSRDVFNVYDNGSVTKPETPYFSVQGSPSINNFTNYTNSVYNFATINSNNGSHYNNSTGRFTAPVAGFYWFSCGLWSSTSDNSGGTYLLNLTRDNIGGGTATELQFAGANHAVEKNQLSVSAGIYMTVGQTVRMWYNGSIQGSTPRNYFSGYLVG